jgi:hypothetical protein
MFDGISVSCSYYVKKLIFVLQLSTTFGSSIYTTVHYILVLPINIGCSLSDVLLHAQLPSIYPYLTSLDAF